MSKEEKLKILDGVLGSRYTNGPEHLYQCPNCDHHKKKLSINIEKNVFKCWVCDWSGKNLYRIIRRCGTTSQRYKWKSLYQQVEIANFSEKLFEEKHEELQEINLPDEFISLANKNLPTTSIYPINYLKSRGLAKKDIIKWKIGYCPSGKYAGRVVIPSFGEEGNLDYFVTRSYDNNWRKYLNPSASRDIVFNHLYVDFDEDLILTEGVFDAVKAGENSVPLLGSTLNEDSKLFYQIVKNDTPVYLALDPDANKKTNIMIKLFLKYDIELYLVEVSPFSDVGEMTKKEFSQRKQSAVLLDSYNYLLSRITGM